MRRAMAAGLLVAVLAGCGADRREGVHGTPSPSRSPTAAAATPSRSPAETQAAPASPRPTRGATTAPATPSTPGAGAPAGGGADAPARPGRYTYDETGMRRLRGCFVVDEPAATPTALTVDPAAGNRQGWIRDRRSVAGSGSLTATTLEFRPDGIFVVSLRQVEVALLASSELVFEPASPVLAFPARPAAGQTWSFTLVSKDGRATLAADNAVEGTGESLQLGGGATVAAVRIRTSTHVAGLSDQGPLDIREVYTSWLSPADRLVVKEVRDTQGRTGPCELSWHLEALLRSAVAG